MVSPMPPDPTVPGPRTSAPPPLLRASQRPLKARCPLPQPLPLPLGGRLLLVPNWDQRGGTLADPARLAHPSRAPETVPSLPTRQYLLRFQLCSDAYERHVPQLPPAATKNPSTALRATRFLHSGLSLEPVREEGGGPAFPPGPGRGQSLLSQCCPRPQRPQTCGASISREGARQPSSPLAPPHAGRAPPSHAPQAAPALDPRERGHAVAESSRRSGLRESGPPSGKGT